MGTQQTRPKPASTRVVGRRLAWADNLKVVLVGGVVVAHVILAWTGLGTWVLEEPHVRDPLLSLIVLVAVVGALFGMPVFFLVAGMFTPRSLERKGFWRFLADRAVRLLVPMALFVLLLSPPVEYVDSDNVGWSRDFWAFAPTVWWPPVPGPTWFLGMLFGFSVVYAVWRAGRPRPAGARVPLRLWHLTLAALAITAASFVVRLWVPVGEEWGHLALGQAPAWVVGFTLGVVGGENRWFAPLEPVMARRVRRLAWAAVLALVAAVAAAVVAGAQLESFFGEGTWLSLVLTVLEGVIVVGMSLWLVDVFQRRFDHQGPLARQLGRAAYATFFIHQPVLVGLVLAVRQVSWPPEVEFLTVAVLGLAISFGLGLALVRLPGASRVL